MIIKSTDLNSLKELFLTERQAWMREHFGTNGSDEEAIAKAYKIMPGRVRAFNCWVRVNHLVSLKEIGRHQRFVKLEGDDANIMKLVLTYDLRPHRE